VIDRVDQMRAKGVDETGGQKDGARWAREVGRVGNRKRRKDFHNMDSLPRELVKEHQGTVAAQEN